jgi:hypothetical protein
MRGLVPDRESGVLFCIDSIGRRERGQSSLFEHRRCKECRRCVELFGHGRNRRRYEAWGRAFDDDCECDSD